ncbi:hypothetical protein [Halapricum hydrolyticum]|uniref:Uncharacterized protein n=1 Tax=Halapricum hydrolyticum TaxID=2979991 RepID=A0AAE3I8X3_9EURY|nr:hypothetical protein [Halapricum hydrolyticum]MCU4716864.1 hypothetical protein [Halapricum hydrolyticum]MCU4725531.1 hypothetical protein [Halapricum hydrolyticum]
MSAAPPEEEVFARLDRVESANKRLEVSDFDQQANTPGELSKVLSYKAERPLFVRPGVGVDLHFVVHEELTTDGSGTQQTFNLLNNLIDSAPVGDDFLLYSGASEASADSVDYDNDSFTYTDGGSIETLHAYYVSDAQAKVEVRKSAPKRYFDIIDERDAGMANLRDQNRDPITFSYEDPVTGLIPKDWSLEIYIDAPYIVQWDDEDDPGAEAVNALVSIPIRRSRENVMGLEDVVINHIGGS